MILRLSLDLPEDAAYIRTTRNLGRCLLEDLKVTESTILDVENIVGELCSNVIRHAQSKAMHFLVTLEYYKPKVVITVKDNGLGFVMDDMLPVGALRSDGNGGERLGGYGMILLEGLSDRLDFTETDPHGTTVRVEKNLRYESQGDADAATRRDTGHAGFATVSLE
ncbi:MAG: ATP-binding protein [Capsulimonadaceae bacterium]|nr:ATP-binding protein [Capsulimonadaceae bacterium]